LAGGESGRGSTGAQYNDQNLRHAENTVLKSDRWLVLRFDDPREYSSQAQALEGFPGMGDSGGPALIMVKQQFYIAGIANGELRLPSAKSQGAYGALEIYERISNHLSWINNTTQQL